MNLPNSLTLFRIFLVPLLVVVLLTKVPNYEIWGLAIFLGAAATDWLDGYFARRRQQVTTLGVLLDPIADKLLISAAFISLVQMGQVPAWMVVIIIGREFAVVGLRNIAAAEGFTIEASELGKTKMVSQVLAVSLIFLGSRFSSLRPFGLIALWLVVFFAVVSAVGYFMKFWRKVDVRFKQRQSRLTLLRRRKKQDVPTQP